MSRQVPGRFREVGSSSSGEERSSASNARRICLPVDQISGPHYPLALLYEGLVSQQNLLMQVRQRTNEGLNLRTEVMPIQRRLGEYEDCALQECIQSARQLVALHQHKLNYIRGKATRDNAYADKLPTCNRDHEQLCEVVELLEGISERISDTAV
uniref:Uncharacterized protein n=1 Tax=Citrus yellow mosaic virus TaxID=174178 RepID=B2L8N5_9VIRU|nr:unknown [Citrus yellow mosaic virus]